MGRMCAECGEYCHSGKVEAESGIWYCSICWDTWDEAEGDGMQSSYLSCIDCKRSLHFDYFSSKQQTKDDPICKDCMIKRKNQKKRDNAEKAAVNKQNERVSEYVVQHQGHGFSRPDPGKNLNDDKKYWVCRLCNTKVSVYDGIVRHFLGKTHIYHCNIALEYGTKNTIPVILKNKAKIGRSENANRQGASFLANQARLVRTLREKLKCGSYEMSKLKSIMMKEFTDDLDYGTDWSQFLRDLHFTVVKKAYRSPFRDALESVFIEYDYVSTQSAHIFLQESGVSLTDGPITKVVSLILEYSNFHFRDWYQMTKRQKRNWIARHEIPITLEQMEKDIEWFWEVSYRYPGAYDSEHYSVLSRWAPSQEHLTGLLEFMKTVKVTITSLDSFLEKHILIVNLENIWKVNADILQILNEDVFRLIVSYSFGLKSFYIESVSFQFDAKLVKWMQDGFPDVIINILLDFVGLASQAYVTLSHGENLGFLWLHEAEFLRHKDDMFINHVPAKILDLKIDPMNHLKWFQSYEFVDPCILVSWTHARINIDDC